MSVVLICDLCGTEKYNPDEKTQKQWAIAMPMNEISTSAESFSAVLCPKCLDYLEEVGRIRRRPKADAKDRDDGLSLPENWDFTKNYRFKGCGHLSRENREYLLQRRRTIPYGK